MPHSRIALGCVVGIPAATCGETNSADGEEIRQSGDVEDLPVSEPGELFQQGAVPRGLVDLAAGRFDAMVGG